MTVTTATPATVGPRMGMIGGALRGVGARLHTDEDPAPTTFQRKIDAARSGEAAAQALANSALLDLAIAERAVVEARQALFDVTVQRDAMEAELVAARPVLDMARAVAHGHRGVADMRAAWIQHTEGDR